MHLQQPYFLLFLWAVSGEIPMFVTVKTLHFGQIQLLAFSLGFWMGFIHLSFPFFGSQSAILFIIILQ